MAWQFDENATHVFNIVVIVNNVFVPQQITKAEFAGLSFGLRASVEGSVLSAELLGRITRHPEDFLVCHASSNVADNDGEGPKSSPRPTPLCNPSAALLVAKCLDLRVSPDEDCHSRAAFCSVFPEPTADGVFLIAKRNLQ
jgi:hypothetical protein